MPQNQFPHGLIAPTDKNNFTGTIVTDNFLMEAIYLFKTGHGYVYAKTLEVLEQRKANGDWSRWKTHPDWYRLAMKKVTAPKKNDEGLYDELVIELN